jgi:hypothetical protein
MRKPATAAVAGAAVLGAVLAGASPSLHAAGATGPSRSQHVLRLVTHQIESHPASDYHPAGVDRLRSAATHEIVGYEAFSGVFNPRNDHLRFWLDMALDGGMLDSYFSTNTTVTSFTGRIIHGTGAYRGVDGTIHVQILASGRTVYTVRYSV